MYDSIGDVTFGVLERLTKKRTNLLKQLMETELEIKLVEKQLTGGASLDNWFDELKHKVNVEGALNTEDTKVTVERPGDNDKSEE